MISEEDKSLIVSLYKEGNSLVKIESETGINRSTITRFLQKEEIRIPDKVTDYSKEMLDGATRGSLIVVKVESYISNTGRECFIVTCECICTNVITIPAWKFFRLKSCGCVKSPPKDISGREFGKLTAISLTGDRNNSSRLMWKCLCKCGNSIDVSINCLLHGNTKSCGCLSRSEYLGEMPKTYWSRIVNGAAERGYELEITREEAYNIYLNQKKKCNLTRLDISFDDKTASLDRIDNTKGYILNNVQWLHKKINRFKNNYSMSELLEMCTLIVNNYKNG